MVYTALTIASEYLMITYPMADFEGKSLRPSIIIPRMKKIFKYLQEESEIYNININLKKNKLSITGCKHINGLKKVKNLN